MSKIDEISELFETINIADNPIKNIPKTNIIMPITVNDITPIYKDTIPNFDGDSNTLNAFITACEFLVSTFLTEANLPVQALLLRIFQGKLTGKALQVVSCNEQCITWTSLKTLLLDHFGDQRSEACLFNDLVTIRPTKSEAAYAFGQRIKETLQLLLTQVKLRDDNANSRILKQTNYKGTALQIYLQGLLEIDHIIGIMVQVKQPADIETAMSYVIDAENFNYRAGRSNNLYRVNKTDKNRQQIHQQQRPIIFQQPIPISMPSKPFNNNNFNNNNFSHSSQKPTFPFVQRNQSNFANLQFPRSQQSKVTPMEVDTPTYKRAGSSMMHASKKPNWTPKISQQLHYQDEHDPENYDEEYEINAKQYDRKSNDIEEIFDETNEDEIDNLNFHLVALGPKKK